MQKIANFVLVIFVITASLLNGQSVGINATGADPDASAMLDVSSTTKGFLAPRMTIEERDAMVSKTAGLMIYQTNSTPGYYFYNGSSWAKLDTGTISSQWVTSGSSIAYNAGNVGIGISNSAFPLEICSPSTAGLKVSLKLTNLTLGIGNAVGIMFAPDDAHIAKMGICVERKAAWGFGTMHFLSRRSYDYASADLSNSVMAITSEGKVGIGTTIPSSKLQVVGLAEYADNAAAIAAGLTVGAFYRTGDLLKVVH